MAPGQGVSIARLRTTGGLGETLGTTVLDDVPLGNVEDVSLHEVSLGAADGGRCLRAFHSLRGHRRAPCSTRTAVPAARTYLGRREPIH